MAEYLTSLAAFASQKCTVEYLRLRAGLHWDELRREQGFAAGLERCRWEAYALVLAEATELAQAFLRRHGADGDGVDRLLVRAAGASLGRFPMPVHRTDWADVTEALALRLAAARERPPRELRKVGAATARRLMDLYPFDERLRAADLDYLRNNLRMALAQGHERMGQAFDVAALRQAAAG